MKDFKSVHEAVLALYSELLTLKKSMLNYIRSIENSKVQETEGINANFQGIENIMKELKDFRSRSYESINQIQHEWLLIKALGWLSLEYSIAKNCNSDYLIQWNPRQTGDAAEPDLRIVNPKAELEINCEATTSDNPQGVMDKRIRTHLECLSKLNGFKYYFVLTEQMKRRAETKIVSNSWDIKVVNLSNEVFL